VIGGRKKGECRVEGRGEMEGRWSPPGGVGEVGES